MGANAKLQRRLSVSTDGATPGIVAYRVVVRMARARQGGKSTMTTARARTPKTPRRSTRLADHRTSGAFDLRCARAFVVKAQRSCFVFRRARCGGKGRRRLTNPDDAMTRRQAIVRRDSPPAARIGRVQRHMDARRKMNRWQCAERGNVSRRIVKESFLRRDDVIERARKEGLVPPTPTPALITRDRNDDDHTDERGPGDHAVAPREE